MSAVIQIPIFPLPDVVLFPHTLLPLHIFEPRYRQMIRDCLAGDKRLAMALLRPGWESDYYGRPPVHPIAGAGEIIQHEELPDGRFNILLRGTMRIGITAASARGQIVRPAMPSQTRSSSARSSGAPSPRRRRFTIRCSQPVPSRQGVHWPHDSSQ